MMDYLDLIIYFSSNLTSSLAIGMEYSGSAATTNASMREALPIVA